MPKMVKLELNPAYKPKDGDDMKAVKKRLAAMRPVSYVTALENIRNSGGMLRIASSEPRVEPKMQLEDMPTDQLKVMMLSAGATPSKKMMSRDEIIKVIRTKMDAFEVVE